MDSSSQDAEHMARGHLADPHCMAEVRRADGSAPALADRLGTQLRTFLTEFDSVTDIWGDCVGREHLAVAEALPDTIQLGYLAECGEVLARDCDDTILVVEYMPHREPLVTEYSSIWELICAWCEEGE